MMIYLSVGLFSMTTLPSQLFEGFQDYNIDEFKEPFNVFADELTEGHNYIIQLSDGIGTSENLN